MFIREFILPFEFTFLEKLREGDYIFGKIELNAIQLDPVSIAGNETYQFMFPAYQKLDGLFTDRTIVYNPIPRTYLELINAGGKPIPSISDLTVRLFRSSYNMQTDEGSRDRIQITPLQLAQGTADREPYYFLKLGVRLLESAD